MKTILVLTDFSTRAAHAAEYALELAAAAGAQILLYNAYYIPQTVPLESGIYPYYDDIEAVQQEGLADMKQLSEKIILKFRETHESNPPQIRYLNEPGRLGENIRNLATKEKLWMIVMGDKSKEGAASRFIFGSDSHDVIDNAKCPVLLVPAKAPSAHLKKIVFATELEPSEHGAILFLKKLAEIGQSEITVLHVCEKTLMIEEKAKHYQDFKKIVSGIEYNRITYEDIRGDDITEAISTYAGRENIDLIAMVHKKRSLAGDLLHRSMSKKMLNYHRIPILVLQKS